MNKTVSLQLFKISLSLALITMGCTPQDNANQSVAYQPINLAEVQGNLTGDDPETITLNLFGIQEEVEGNFSQEIEVIEEEGFNQTLIFTQMNLPDDSVKGMRYRLQFQFDQSQGQWRLNEVGRQQSCRRGDNPTDWTIEPCP